MLTTVSNDLRDLLVSAQFTRTVDYVLVEQSTNLALAHGIKGGSGVLLTNLFLLNLRDQHGQVRSYAGKNETRAEFNRLSNLKENETYVFPDVLAGGRVSP